MERHGLDAETKRVLKNFYRTYRALKFNTPAVILTFDYDKKEKNQGSYSKAVKEISGRIIPWRIHPRKQDLRIQATRRARGKDKPLSCSCPILNKHLSKFGKCKDKPKLGSFMINRCL